MGTRADFYLGRGTDAKWLGSIAWDGYPDGIDPALLKATRLAAFLRAVARLETREDWTAPAAGWPWPWTTSATTDYAYAFDDGEVHASCFGSEWFRASGEQPETPSDKSAIFPDMSARQRVTFGPRSGVMIFTSKGLIDVDEDESHG